MSIATPAMRTAFINGLGRRYARLLPTKHISNRNDISFGAVKLFDSGTPFRPLFSNDPQPFMREQDSPLLATTLDPLVDKFWCYFNSAPAPTTQADFDVVHSDLCSSFLHIFAAYGYSYGNAAKFVNVLFKYLACYADSVAFTAWFKYCHLTLDRYTYNGYNLHYYGNVICPALDYPIGTLAPWSRLTKEEYDTVVSNIVTYIASHPRTYNYYLDICHSFSIFASIPLLPVAQDYVLTPFETEFFLWQIAKYCKDTPAAVARAIEARL